jgi:hypothetical protein
MVKRDQHLGTSGTADILSPRWREKIQFFVRRCGLVVDLERREARLELETRYRGVAVLIEA